jgi:hypothetical protein
MKITKTILKDTFNTLAIQSQRGYKYKRSISCTSKTIIFDVYNEEKTIFSNFYGIKLLSHSTRKKITTFHCDAKEIELIIKYNLKKDSDTTPSYLKEIQTILKA